MLVYQIGKIAQSYADRFGFRLERPSHGYYILLDKARVVRDISIRPTAKSAVAMMRKHVAAGNFTCRREP